MSPANPAGNISATNHPHQVIELATGMHYWDGQQWTPSNPNFEATNGGFAVMQTQHKVLLSSNIFVSGSVNLTTPDGIALQSTPLGIGLYDAASGDFLLIGQITNSTGIQVSSNQIVFPDAFSGVCANLVYTMNRGSFQQDVVFTGKVDPAAYGFPTNTTRIQVITEFYGSPNPQVQKGVLQAEPNQAVRNQMASPDLLDQTLSFGKFVLGHGRAFLTGTNVSGNPNAMPGAPVGKAFTQVQQRLFLIESVKYQSVWKDLQSLPDCN